MFYAGWGVPVSKVFQAVLPKLTDEEIFAGKTGCEWHFHKLQFSRRLLDDSGGIYMLHYKSRQTVWQQLLNEIYYIIFYYCEQHCKVLFVAHAKSIFKIICYELS